MPAMAVLRRSWFLLLLVALLPWRGWVGDAMAFEMLRMGSAPMSAAAGGLASGAGMSDCPMHAAAGAASSEDGSSAPQADRTEASKGHADGHAAPCTLCDICHGSCAAPDTPALAALRLPTAPPSARLPHGLALHHAPDLRPPIAAFPMC